MERERTITKQILMDFKTVRNFCSEHIVMIFPNDTWAAWLSIGEHCGKQYFTGKNVTKVELIAFVSTQSYRAEDLKAHMHP